MGIESCGMLLSAIHEEEGEEKLHLLMVDDHIPAGAKIILISGHFAFSEILKAECYLCYRKLLCNVPIT